MISSSARRASSMFDCDILSSRNSSSDSISAKFDVFRDETVMTAGEDFGVDSREGRGVAD